MAIKKPVRQPKAVDRAHVKEDADQFSAKLSQLLQAQQAGFGISEIHLTQAEVNAVMAETLDTQISPQQRGQAPAVASQGQSTDPTVPPQAQSSRDVVPPAAPEHSAGQVPLKDAQVEFIGNEVVGHFVADVYGKDVYLTVSGHLGSQGGYATFEPTGFKIGDLAVPASLVNAELQKKLSDPETREKLKLPAFVSSLQVVNGELVITRN
jgi:hypothetical protein